MQLYSATIRLKGSLYNEVAKINLTAAEIMVLRQIHGGNPEDEDADMEVDNTVDPSVVAKVTKTGEVARADGKERLRLGALYNGSLKRFPNIKSINGVFGVGTPLPQSLPDDEDIIVAEEPIKKLRKPRKTKAAPVVEEVAEDDPMAELVG